jgi:chromosome segregation ATPase
MTTEPLLIKVHYELKDEFKKLFRTAKWNNNEKKWEVKDCKQNINKLAKWSEMTAETEAQLDEKKQFEKDIDECKDELFELEMALEGIKKEAEHNKKLQEKLLEINAEIENIKKEKSDVIALLEASRKQNKEEALKIEESLKSIIDIEKIERCHQIMISKKDSIYSTDKEKYREAQSEIGEEIEKLAKIGLQSAGLNELYNMNVNRPDKYKPYDVTMLDILYVYKIT